MDAERPIKTLEDARRCFQSMGCSHDHMAREAPARFTEYRLLGVSEAVERVWRRERIKEETARLSGESCSPKDYWALFSSLEALVSAQREPEPLSALHELTARLAAKVRDEDAVAVAQTILGRAPREARSGLVYLSFDLGRKDLAASFAEVALALCARARAGDEARTREALALCTSLQAELAL